MKSIHPDVNLETLRTNLNTLRDVVDKLIHRYPFPTLVSSISSHKRLIRYLRQQTTRILNKRAQMPLQLSVDVQPSWVSDRVQAGARNYMEHLRNELDKQMALEDTSDAVEDTPVVEHRLSNCLQGITDAANLEQFSQLPVDDITREFINVLRTVMQVSRWDKEDEDVAGKMNRSTVIDEFFRIMKLHPEAFRFMMLLSAIENVDHGANVYWLNSKFAGKLLAQFRNEFYHYLVARFQLVTNETSDIDARWLRSTFPLDEELMAIARVENPLYDDRPIIAHIYREVVLTMLGIPDVSWFAFKGNNLDEISNYSDTKGQEAPYELLSILLEAVK